MKHSTEGGTIEQAREEERSAIIRYKPPKRSLLEMYGLEETGNSYGIDDSKPNMKNMFIGLITILIMVIAIITTPILYWCDIISGITAIISIIVAIIIGFLAFVFLLIYGSS